MAYVTYKLATRDVVDQRALICKSCQDYNDENKSAPICDECHCDLIKKWGYEEATCPREKW